MSRERANIGFDDALSGFDPSDWRPTGPTHAKPPKEATQAAAEATGFRSRERAPLIEPTPVSVPLVSGAGAPETSPRLAPAPLTPPRRRRTGRNAQLNLKARQDMIDRFCAVADGQGWGLGETLEYAVVLLEKTYGLPPR